MNKEMITVEAWTTIRYLHAQGKSVRAIAKELGLSRNTVRGALRAEQAPRYTREARPNPKLEPFRSQIEEMYLQKQFIGSRILVELRRLGYQGGASALYAHLRTLKEARQSSRVSERFETPPGQQAQFDWSPYTVSLGGLLVKVVVFCLTLSFSRRKFYWPSLDETQSSIFEALESGLRHFGGAPKELLVDNARSFVADASPQHFAWNVHFLELCGHYRLQPRACQPGRPRTKGKVERPFFYLEEHLIKGGTWSSFEAFAQALADFVAQDLDLRVHATTLERPIDRFGQEQPLLTPLPLLPFLGTQEEMRKVSWDCLISCAGCRYSVPWAYAGKQVWIRLRQGRQLIVRNQSGAQIAAHLLAARKGSTVLDPAHYEGLRQRLAKTRPLLQESFRTRFPEQDWFLEGVLIQHPNNALDHLRAILALAEVYPAPALCAAFERAREYNTYTHRFVRGLLESGVAEDAPLTGRDRPQAGDPTPSRALAPYQQILEASA
jgi:transposase